MPLMLAIDRRGEELFLKITVEQNTRLRSSTGWSQREAQGTGVIFWLPDRTGEPVGVLGSG